MSQSLKNIWKPVYCHKSSRWLFGSSFQYLAESARLSELTINYQEITKIVNASLAHLLPSLHSPLPPYSHLNNKALSLCQAAVTNPSTAPFLSIVTNPFSNEFHDHQLYSYKILLKKFNRKLHVKSHP